MRIWGGLLALFAIVRLMLALGVEVSPGRLELWVKPGTSYVSSDITISNPDNFGKTIVVSFRARSEDRNILAIPDPDWVKVLSPAVKLGPGQKGAKIIFKVTIPDSSVYYNRRFAFELYIRQGGNGAYSAGVIIPVLIMTQPSREIPRECKGCTIEVYPCALTIKSSMDSVSVVNWTGDTLEVSIGWNDPKQDGWQQALMIMQRVMGTFVPIKKSFSLHPGEKKKIFIKPLAYPGKGRLYFSAPDGVKTFLWLEWGEI